MARPIKQAWTPSADIYWWGELSDDFRSRADDILSTRMSDAAWDGLQRCVRVYAMGLNHELAAVPLSEQVEALRHVSDASAALISAIAAANTQARGLAVSYHVGDAWASFFDHEAEFERNLDVMASDLSTGMSDDDAWGLLNIWLRAGRIQRPSPVADLTVTLEEFRTAAVIARKSLEAGTAPSSTKGNSFQEFIGVLYEWKADHRINAGVSKGSGSNAGRLTYLVKAVIKEVPELLDEGGNKQPKQMRRPHVADASLAQAVITAAKAYEGARPKVQQGK